MFRKLSLLFASCALGLHSPAGANFVLEPTFAEKMARSELVVIGTVTAVDPGGERGVGSTATLDVWWTIKESTGTRSPSSLGIRSKRVIRAAAWSAPPI
jgi:hypothetical protein